MLEIVPNWHPLWVHFAIALLIEHDARVAAIPDRQEAGRRNTRAKVGSFVIQITL
jgi:hypothetical protein